MKKLLLIAFIAIPALAPAQKKNKTAEKYAKTITADELKTRLFTVASAENAGRDTPSPGLENAANYIESNFKSFGLLPGNNGTYRQFYPLFKDSVLSSQVVVNGQSFDPLKDYIVQSSNYSHGMNFSEFVFAGYGIVDDQRNDYKDLDVTGKLVVILDGMPEGYKPVQPGMRSPSGTFGKLQNAQKKSAAAVLVIAGNFPRRAGNDRGSWNIRGFSSMVTPPLYTVSENIAASLMGKDGEKILTAIKTQPLDPKVYKANITLGFTKTTTTGSAANVLGYVEGTDKKDEWVIVTAHYDHVGTRNGNIYYGADDDGSGTVSVLEMAEAFAKAKAEGKGPRRSILFMTVSGEEHGLWGSAHYADNPVYPLEKTTVNLNIDMIGRVGNEYQKETDSANYVYIIGDDKLSSDLTPITDQVNNTYTKLKLDRKYNDPKDPNRFYYRSDHYNFAEKGIPIIFYFNGVHKDYHQPTDTPDKINYGLMEKRARLVFFTAWEMANRNEMLKRDIPLNK